MSKVFNQIDLFNNLESLVKNNPAFYCKDFELSDNSIMRIYNYRLASWGDFQSPGALDARGTMFNIKDSTIRLASYPMSKFFNYGEGPIDYKDAKINHIMIKMDGSLISSYLFKDKLLLKSKGHLYSSQSLAAQALLSKLPKLEKEIYELVKNDFTVNLEYTAPNNQIVIFYPEEKLTVLSIRDHKTGINYHGKELIKNFASYSEIIKNSVQMKKVDYNNLSDFVKIASQELEGEGYVLEAIKDDQKILLKIKNEKYLAAHRAKEQIYSDLKLIEAILAGSSDDLRSLFITDQITLDRISEMENRVFPYYNNLVLEVESFHKNNKNLIRKDYAIKAQQQYPELMSLLMNIYLNKELDYKSFILKNAKTIFNIKNEEQNLEEKMKI